MSHEGGEMVRWRERPWRENRMDPIGQFYLPGYFCPAALFDSRETTQDKGRVGQRQHREIIVPRIKTEMNRKTKRITSVTSY